VVTDTARPPQTHRQDRSQYTAQLASAQCNNNNNNHNDIYNAVMMTEVIVRVHSVHLMNVEQRQAAADPQTKPPDLGYESTCFRQLASTTTTPFIIITQPESWYSITIPRRVEGWVYLGTAGRVHRASAQDCKSQWFSW